jgi:MYXO-CTERM domain-containing protein
VVHRSKWPIHVGFALSALTVSSLAFAGQPELDRVAASRGLAAGELTIATSLQVPAGTALRNAKAERRSLSLHGIPLRGGFETVWQSSAGSAERVIASRYPASAPQFRPEQLRVDLDQARERFAAELAPELRARFSSPDAMGGELVYLLLVDKPVLAWEFTTPVRMSPSPSRTRVWISAMTGRTLETEELLHFANETEVYAFNPKHTPDPSLVTLTNIDPDAEPWTEEQSIGQYLNGTRVRAFNCIDAPDGPYAAWYEEGECFPTQQVHADAAGDFFVPLPDVKIPDDNLDPVDLYAELSMYYHAEKFFAFMEALGVEGFPCEISTMLANYHWLEPAPGYPQLSFGPYNNAFFAGECDVQLGPTMVFGQGSSVDFAYDGDVVYHELGHGIVQQLTPDGLRSYRLREDGVLRDARAINEAIADYHTFMITNRPELAEYVGSYWAELDKAWIRNGDNELRCPQDMTGEEHYDGEPFAAGLWAARKRIGGDKLDPVVLASLPLLASDASIEEASAALLTIADAEREAGTWTADDYDTLERTLASRNLLDCPRVVDDAQLTEPRILFLRANSRWVSPFWPGPVQYRHVVPEGSDNLLISFEVSGGGNSAGQPVNTDVDPRILIKRSGLSADAPIVFEYETAAVGHADDEDADVEEVREVYGDWDEIYVPTVLTGSRRQVLIRKLAPGEALHLSFVNLSRETAVIRELQFASVPTEQLDDGSLIDGAEQPLIDDGNGCACASASQESTGWGAALGLLVLVSSRRRRSRAR